MTSDITEQKICIYVTNMQVAEGAANMSVLYDRPRLVLLTEFYISSKPKSRLKTPGNHMTAEVSMAVSVVSI